MKEIWKDIKGYEDRYQISNLGRVKSLEKKIRFIHKQAGECFRIAKDKILKPCMDNMGYFSNNLSKNHIHNTIRIHRLVAEAFIPNPENKPCINHIDGNRQNNNIDNLEWCTYSENTKHAFKIGNMDNRGENQSRHKLFERDVLWIRANKDKYKIKELAKLFNVSYNNLWGIINNKSWTHI